MTVEVPSTLSHFQPMVFDVADLERSRRFYGEVLGLDPVPAEEWPAEGADQAAFKTLYGQYVVLVQAPSVQPDGLDGHPNFMLASDDYPAVFERLKNSGYLIPDHTAEQGRRWIGLLTSYLDDPDGRRLRITAYRTDVFQVPAAKRGRLVAGRVEDFAVGSVTHNAEGQFFLVRLDDGVLALNQVCTHEQCDLLYQAEHLRFWCPCHNRRFTRTGKQIAIEADVPPLHAYALEVVDGQIVVDTDRSLPRRPEDADQLAPVRGR